LKAPVRIEVFSDFECPGCRLFYKELIRPLLQDYASRDKVCVIYHEFPLSNHKYSQKAARYCEAAYRLGREKAILVMNALFAEQDEWTQDGNIEKTVAKALPPRDLSKLRAILKDPGIDRSIEEGIKLGIERDVRGTPTMFLYYLGKRQKVESPQQMSYLTLKQFLDQIVK
jgi:protein-disulfide isomerase